MSEIRVRPKNDDVQDRLEPETDRVVALPNVPRKRRLGYGGALFGGSALLLRGDSVAFPPGGCAYRHRHQGPGLRCLLEGGIRIDTHGRSTSYGPGGAWYETGPDAVFAQAADRPTRFIRVMILPRALIGKSSIQYVNDEDKAKPKSQQYRVFVDAPLNLRRRSLCFRRCDLRHLWP